jgi:hypothetical protein
MNDNSLKRHSLEVTGLGMIAGVIIASGSLVADGSFELSHYLVFLGFMLMGAAGLVWRLLNPSVLHGAKSGE